MHPTAVITDIVNSRGMADRSAGQGAVRDSFSRAHNLVNPREPLWATAGDEFQSVYRTVEDALTVSLLVRLFLPQNVDCRFGIGKGEIRHVERVPEGTKIEDGSAWWNAREAITFLHRKQEHGHPYLRTWFADGSDERSSLINAYLAARDHIVSRMKVGERRTAAAALAGLSQQHIARSEKISQSAVSQTLQRSGATALAFGIGLFATPGA